MALQWYDNFQQYGTTVANMLNGVYAEAFNTLVADPDATAGGTTVAKLAGGNVGGGKYFRKVITAVPTVGVMCRVWLSSLSDNTNCQQNIVLTDGSNVEQMTFQITPTGSIRAYRGTTSGTLLGESTVAIVANGWQRVEIKVAISSSVGTVRVDVERTTVLTLTSQNTKATADANVANVTIRNAGQGTNISPDMYVKDFIVWDTTGSFNNDVLGTCFVYSMRPSGDVSGTWTITGGAGSAYASINESTPDDDTKYISSPFPAATADILTLGDLPASATRVLGLMALARSRKSDGGDGNLQVSMVSGASTGNGADRAITTAYTYWSDIFETDPATSAAWTVAAANGANVKFNRTL